METVGGASSSTIVTVVVPPVTVTLTGLERLTVKVSSFSSMESPTAETVTCLTVSPGAKVRVVAGSAV